jgi:quinol monooxygenase YgiN
MNEPSAIVTIVARAGREDELQALLAQMAEVALADDGAEAYDVHRSRSEPSTYFIYERYRDAAAFKTHRANTRLTELGAGMGDLSESVTLVIGNRV